MSDELVMIGKLRFFRVRCANDRKMPKNACFFGGKFWQNFGLFWRKRGDGFQKMSKCWRFWTRNSVFKKGHFWHFFTLFGVENVPKMHPKNHSLLEAQNRFLGKRRGRGKKCTSKRRREKTRFFEVFYEKKDDFHFAPVLKPGIFFFTRLRIFKISEETNSFRWNFGNLELKINLRKNTMFSESKLAIFGTKRRVTSLGRCDSLGGPESWRSANRNNRRS